MLNTGRCLSGGTRKRQVLVSKKRTRIPTPPSGIRSRTPEIQNNSTQRFDAGTQGSSAGSVSEVNAGRLGGYVIQVDVGEEHGIGSGH